ncbi:MAG TPA: hypothetical protein VKI44_11340, partial [Acetobacteraceae bacterium]|nr:hypothetical protein [Acetobacteraceae bacterium]
MKTAEPEDRCDTPNRLRRSVERTILVEGKVRAGPIEKAAVVRQQIAKVLLPEHHMVEAFTSDQANQPLNMTVLPRRAGRNRPVSNSYGSA